MVDNTLAHLLGLPNNPINYPPTRGCPNQRREVFALPGGTLKPESHQSRHVSIIREQHGNLRIGP